MANTPTIFFTAAEASGDSHGAGLVAALRERLPNARLVGAGGAKMADSGCEILLDMTAQAAMLHGAVMKLRYFHRCLRQLRSHVRQIKPDVIVPIDSPALNWHVAKAARKQGVPVMYYVAPQVWAWAPWRVQKLRKLTDRVACILPFEEEYLRKRGVNATFVGHPMFDHMPPRPDDLPDLSAAALSGEWRVALLPGSRPGEIAAHAPAMLAAAQAIRKQSPNAICAFTAGNEAAAERIRQATGHLDLPVEVGRTSEVLAESHFAVTSSGTATLQVAHYGVPMVIVYRASKWGYRLFGRWLIRTRHLSLVNVLAGREVVPELMPWFGDVDEVVHTTLMMMSDVFRLHQIRDDLLTITAPLENRPQSTAEATADLVMKLLDK
ncbi:MAG: lipid-A-disaccharide synthase [Planctomycetota bacterium]|jgi:lipid-A-disaccharide synthase